METLRSISFEEFLDSTDGQHVEWVDGKVIPKAAVESDHDELTTFLVIIISQFVESKGLGSVHKEPFVMKAGPDLPGRSPDVLFLAASRRDRLQRLFLDGPADLAIEVVSRDSPTRDRGEKFYEYEQGGVREFWLLDPLRRQAEFYVLNDQGRFEPAPTPDGRFQSAALPGFWLIVDWLWQRPSTLEVARQLGLLG